MTSFAVTGPLLLPLITWKDRKQTKKTVRIYDVLDRFAKLGGTYDQLASVLVVFPRARILLKAYFYQTTELGKSQLQSIIGAIPTNPADMEAFIKHDATRPFLDVLDFLLEIVPKFPQVYLIAPGYMRPYILKPVLESYRQNTDLVPSDLNKKFVDTIVGLALNGVKIVQL